MNSSKERLNPAQSTEFIRGTITLFIPAICIWTRSLNAYLIYGSLYLQPV